MGKDFTESRERAGAVAPTAPEPGAARFLNPVGASRFVPDWLELREPADNAARAQELLEPLLAYLSANAPPTTGPLVVHDLGCGTGSMARWLAGRLRGTQRWIMHDRDPELVRRAAADTAALRDADGGTVSVVPEEGDVTGLRAEQLVGTSLVTASALLDLLTDDEVDDIAAACIAGGCPALFSLSVVGRVELDPPDPLDDEIVDAFNAHQRRAVGGRQLLGPDALDAATQAFDGRGATVHTCASPWWLGPDDAALTTAWLEGWVGAACAQRPELAPHADAYLRRRLDACAAGQLYVVVHHRDLLALPASSDRAAP